MVSFADGVDSFSHFVEHEGEKEDGGNFEQRNKLGIGVFGRVLVVPTEFAFVVEGFQLELLRTAMVHTN